MIPVKITKMPARLNLLIMESIRVTGTLYPAEDALRYMEEQFTGPEWKRAVKFLDWVHRHSLKFGHGTIDLRWHEFLHNLEPASQDEAYNYAMKQAGF